MLKRILAALCILFCFILQSSVFGKIAFAGIIPNLMIVLTSVFGFMRGEEEGLLAGFFCGLLTDLFFGNFLGFYALIYMYIGFLNGLFHGIFYPEDIKLPIALIVTSDFTYGILCYVLLFMLRGRFEFFYYFTKIILPEALYTIVITIVLYPLILFFDLKLDAGARRGMNRSVR